MLKINCRNFSKKVLTIEEVSDIIKIRRAERRPDLGEKTPKKVFQKKRKKVLTSERRFGKLIERPNDRGLKTPVGTDASCTL